MQAHMSVTGQMSTYVLVTQRMFFFYSMHYNLKRTLLNTYQLHNQNGN